MGRARQRAGGPRRATVVDVARAARVSTATVSRVLTDRARVSPALDQRVRKAADALGYEANRLARQLRTQRGRSIGVVIPDIENPFFTGVVRGIDEVLQQASYTLLLGNSDEIPSREQLYLTTLRAEGAAGLLFVPINRSSAGYRALLRGVLPVVAIDRMPTGLRVDLVTVDNTEGSRGAVAHLAALGHRRIGFIGGPHQHSTARERMDGYVRGLQEAGIALQRQLMIDGDFRDEGGYWAMRSLVEQPAPPSAVFVANNRMTMGALRAIHERGLRIPADMAVVGFDDMPWAASLQPPLTAVAQPAREIGRQAAELLIARLREPGRPAQRVTLKTRLVVRASCGGRAEP